MGRGVGRYEAEAGDGGSFSYWSRGEDENAPAVCVLGGFGVKDEVGCDVVMVRAIRGIFRRITACLAVWLGPHAGSWGISARY